jgi:hypothetical protein
VGARGHRAKNHRLLNHDFLGRGAAKGRRKENRALPSSPCNSRDPVLEPGRAGIGIRDSTNTQYGNFGGAIVCLE